MLNASYSYRAPQALVVPNGTAGWKTLGTIYNGVAGYMSWKDKQKQAKRINDAQDKYYDALIEYLNGKRESEPEKPVEVSVAEEVQETTPLEEQTNDYVGRSDVQNWIDDEKRKQSRAYKWGVLSHLPDAEKSANAYNALKLLGGV